jgi:N-acetylneuraminic acid mutarotase
VTAPHWAPIAASPLGARHAHSAVWTGSAMIVFGGYASSSTPSVTYADGAAYDPAGDAWTLLPDAGIGKRSGHSAVWTGSQMLVFGGGATMDGAAYDPASKSWTPIPAAPLSLRYGFVAVWATTTHELLVWSGANGSGTADWALTDGAAYDPTAKTWRTLAVSPLAARTYASAVWDGKEMVVYGGNWTWYPNAQHDDAATYDPATDTWTMIRPSHKGDPLTEYDGVEAANAEYVDGLSMFYGGTGDHPSHYPIGRGWTWDASTSTMASIGFGASLPPDFARAYGASFVANHRMWIFGGRIAPSSTSERKNVDTGMWIDTRAPAGGAMPTTGAPSPREDATAVWTGDRAIVWGGVKWAFLGFGTDVDYADGAAFFP